MLCMISFTKSGLSPASSRKWRFMRVCEKSVVFPFSKKSFISMFSISGSCAYRALNE